MLHQRAVFGLVALALALLGLASAIAPPYVVPADIDINRYCGIAPYPERAPAIQKLSQAAMEIPGLSFLGTSIFFRHGDRLTETTKCFDKVKDQVEWKTCQNPVKTWHSGLAARSTDTDRTAPFGIPVQPMPNKQVMPGQCFLGQLTQRGVMMSYNNGDRVGRYLNRTFQTLTKAKFNPDTLKYRSTDYHRTRETAQSFLTGFFDNMPPLAPQAPYTTKDFMPQQAISTIGYVESQTDALAINDKLCDATAFMKAAFSAPDFMVWYNSEYKGIQAELRDVLQDPTADLYGQFDCMKVYHCSGVSLPAGVPALHARMEAALLNYWVHPYKFNPVTANKKLSGGLVFELLPVWSAIQADTQPFVQIWSGHDFGPMLNFINLLDIGTEAHMWPQYSSLLQVEFYANADKTKYARFLYNAKVVLPAFCTTPVAGELCQLSDLVAHMTKMVPTVAECPGLPRRTIESYDLAMKAAHSAELHPATDFVEESLAAIDHRDHIAALTAIPEVPVEKSHQERWSTFS